MDTIRMTDRSGDIIDMPRDQAEIEMKDPSQRYVPSTNEEIATTNKEKQYGTLGQQAIAAGEGLLDSATLGISKPVIKGAMNLISPDLGEQYKESAEAREQQNPMSAMVGQGVGIATDPFGIFGGIAKTGKIMEKVATPLIENTIGNGIAGSAARLATRLGTEGFAFGSVNELANQTYDGNGFAPDAVLSAGLKGAGLFTLIGAPIHATLEATNFMLGKTKNFAKDYLDKVTSAGTDSSGEQISNVSRDNLTPNKFKENGNVTERPSVNFKVEEDGTILHEDGKRKININMPSGNGIDISNPESMIKVGSDLGISKLDEKITNLGKNETLNDFLIKEKVSDDARVWLETNHDLISDIDKEILLNPAGEDFTSMANKYKEKISDMNKQEVFKGNKPKYTEFSQETSEKIATNKVNEYIKSLDYLKNGQDIHIFNRQILPEEMTSLRSFGEKSEVTAKEAGISKQYKVEKALRGEIGDDFSKVTQIISDQYPNKLSKVGDITTSFDYVAKGVASAFDQATERLQNSVNRSASFAEKAGIKPTLTNEMIADYLDKQVAPQYLDPMTGNPRPNQSSAYEAVKKMANEFRETRFEIDKYGKRQYVPYDNREMWDLRKSTDLKVNWSNPDAVAISNANHNLRFHIDDSLINQIKKIPNGDVLAKEYIDSKKNWQLHNWANEIIGKAAEKALDKAAKSGFDLNSAVWGGILKGPKGFLLGGAKGYIGDFLNNYSGNIQVYMSNSLNNNVTDYLSKIDSSVNGFFSKSEKIIIPMAAKTISSNDARNMKADFKKLQHEIANREEFGNSFVSLNNTFFQAAPNTANATLATVNRAFDFLNSKIPKNPYDGIPYKEGKWVPSAMDVSRYYRYRQAVENPSSILSQVKDSYVTPEAIEVLQAVYPQTLQLLREKMVEKASLQKDIPIKTRVMIFKTFGIPMDDWQKPQLFASMQQKANIGVQKTAQGQNQVVNPSKISENLLSETQGTRTQKTET